MRVRIAASDAQHDKMLAARTPEDRHASMAEQVKLMHSGMGMMEQRMDMMQSMMQVMADRAAPLTFTPWKGLS